MSTELYLGRYLSNFRTKLRLKLFIIDTHVLSGELDYQTSVVSDNWHVATMFIMNSTKNIFLQVYKMKQTPNF